MMVILKTQSFTDIITNSSSELFVVKGDRYSSAFEDSIHIESVADLQRYLERVNLLLPEILKYCKNDYGMHEYPEEEDYKQALREAVKHNDLDIYLDCTIIELSDHMDHETWSSIRDSLFPHIYYESWH